MKIAFRADASVDIGAGHVMRCLALADRLCAEGADTRFLCQPLRGHLGKLISTRKHALVELPIREDFTRDAEDSLAALVDHAPWDWLVVDHYGLDAAWERALRAVAQRILVIDDLADRPHDGDLLLDQNYHPQPSERYAGLVPADCELLLGPRYALLRPQFAQARQHLRTRSGEVKRLLICFGGSDPQGATRLALEAVRRLNRPDLMVDVVVGAANPHRAAIEAACRALPRTTLHCQVEEVAALMDAADLFIGAGGTSSWERCCMGLPALVIATADNQIAQAKALAHAGAQIYLGVVESLDAESLARRTESMLELPELLAHLTKQCQALVDGLGADRVADHILVDALWLRRAQPSDSTILHAWRNHPEVRRFSLDPAEIDRASHERWFSALLQDGQRELLIAELHGRPIGVLRYDLSGEHGLVSIYRVPGLVGRGWGRRILLAGERWLRKAHPGVKICEADVLIENAASLALFQSAGYRPHRTRFRKELHEPHGTAHR